MRGVYLFSMALGSPLGKLKALPGHHLSAKELYRGPGVDVFHTIDRGLDHAREVLSALGSMIRRNSFSSRSRIKLLELCPEGSPAEVSRAQAA
jgi:hypothetical protein